VTLKVKIEEFSNELNKAILANKMDYLETIDYSNNLSEMIMENLKKLYRDKYYACCQATS